MQFTSKEIADFSSTLAMELARLAEGDKLFTLAYIFRMAALEARSLTEQTTPNQSQKLN